MSLKQLLRRLAEKLTRTHIYRTVPRGIDFVEDIARSLPTFRVEVIFDVGANIGQSAQIYLAEFPESKIFCFEPVSSTFLQLQENLRGSHRVTCCRLALGTAKGRGRMALQGTSDLFFLVSDSQKTELNENVTIEPVEIIPLDAFCAANGIAHINYLKIDTEGGDLDVLKGSLTMLSEQKIDLVQVEAGMNPRNRRHVPFGVLKDFLESHHYFLFGIYEQFHEWPTGEPHLRRTNPLFISQRMIEVYRELSQSLTHI